ncbi:MAG: glycosyltransferase [Candidatus ainarchaeum sp.]|nr:glycosyltransferase [Candidatus ainarchaeum sp.]
MKVFVSACGEGLGHTSRVLALHDALKKAGHSVALAGYGRSLEVMRKHHAKDVLETFPEVQMTGKNGKFDFISSIVKSSGTPLDIMRAYLLEKRAMEEMGADAAVSDSRLSTVIAGAMRGLPTFYVTNQSEFMMPALTGRVMKIRALQILAKARIPNEAVRRIVDAPLSAPYGFADRVLVPDFSPPNTVCLPLLSRELEMRKKTFFTGPMNALCERAPKPAKWDGGKAKVLVSFGGQAFREGMLEKIMRAASRLPRYEFIIAGLIVKRDMDFNNMKLRRFLPELHPYAAAADMLVIPAGHSSIMEAILLEKPFAVIPDKGQPEQESNAKTCERLGLGKMLAFDHVSLLGHTLGKLEAERGAVQRKLSFLAEAARAKENGARNATRMVEEFVERIRY